MKPASILTIAFSILSATACQQAGTDSPKPEKPLAGVVHGNVYDSQGKPLVGATIVANSANYYNNNPSAVSDANGNYKIALPTGPSAGSFYVRGSFRVKY